MDVGTFFNVLTGNANKQFKLDVQLVSAASEQQQQKILDHLPSWKLHKNPFWRMKYNNKGYSNSSNNNNHPFSKNAIFIYEPSDDISGNVIVTQLPSNNNPQQQQPYVTDHLGISIQLIGRIDMSNSSASVAASSGGGGGGGIMMHHHPGNHLYYDFMTMSKELVSPGKPLFFTSSTTSTTPATNHQHHQQSMQQQQQVLYIPFKFKNVDAEYESYTGKMVAVRYILQVKMERKYLPPITFEKDVWFQIIGTDPTTTTTTTSIPNNSIQPPPHTLAISPIANDPIKMEVGIEDCLHIEFEYNHKYYHVHDTIYGSIRFLLVSIKLKHMELAVIRREYSGDGVANRQIDATNNNTIDTSNVYTETQTLVKYEIMDGAPIKGEVIPVKLSLMGIPADITPTYTAINNRFSVKYFLNLVLVDEDDRRYFKQQEIILWRKFIGQ